MRVGSRSQPIRPLKLPQPPSSSPIPPSPEPRQEADGANGVAVWPDAIGQIARDECPGDCPPERSTNLSTEPPTPPRPTPRTQRGPSSRRCSYRRLGLALLYLTAAGLVGGVGAAAYLRLAHLPALPNCAQVDLSSSQRLYCAQQKAQSGTMADLLAGINALTPWSTDDPFYQNAQTLLASWSDAVLLLSRHQAEQGNFQGAVAAARQIPSSSPAYGVAQAAIAQWNQGTLAQPYLARAQTLAQSGTAADLRAAIAQAQRVADHQPDWPQAQTFIHQWRQAIVALEGEAPVPAAIAPSTDALDTRVDPAPVSPPAALTEPSPEAIAPPAISP